MRIPFMTRLLSKFRTTAQLAYLSAKDVHQMKERVHEQHKIWHEIKHTLLHISELEKQLPKGRRHKVMEKVFDQIDALNEGAKRYEKATERLHKHLDNLKEQVEREARANPHIQKAEKEGSMEEREARKIAMLEHRRKEHERQKERHMKQAERERAA